MTKCKRCGGKNCTCKKSIGELARANPTKTYNELEQMKEQKDLSNGGLVIDSTDDCESCQ